MFVVVVEMLGATTLNAESELCVENPLEEMGRPPRDESACGSLGATLLAVGAAFFEDCSPSNPEVSRKYSEIAARYAGMPPNVGLPAMAAWLTAEVGKDGTRCAIRAVIMSGEVEARIASRRAERRMTAACSEDVIGGAADLFSGDWQCPQRGMITLTASGDSVTGSVSGRPGEHWGAGQRAGGRITGKVVGRSLQLVMESGDGTVSRLTGTLAIDGRGFSGPWEWFRGETRLAGGTWNCQRPAGYVPPPRRTGPIEVTPPAAPGPTRLSFEGRVLEVLYERGADSRGVPIDLYYYRTPTPAGAPEPQGDPQWSRFVRVPAAGSTSAEPVVWWHARWDFGPKGWVSVSEQGITPPQAVR